MTSLSNSIGKEIRVAHYLPYCSKFLPIERRFFPHVGRACAGMLFDTIESVVTLMRRASTSSGLRTTVNVMRRYYENGRNASEEMKQNLQIVYDHLLPRWNYVTMP